jgi:hypothetical protein
MPYYNLFVPLKAAAEDEFETSAQLEDAAIDMMISISEAIADDTFEAMVFGITMLNPLQARITVQMTRPLEVAMFAAAVEPFVATGLVARLSVAETLVSSKGKPLADGAEDAVELLLDA